MNTPAKDEDKRTGLTLNEVKEAVAFREKMLNERRGQEGEDPSAGVASGSGVTQRARPTTIGMDIPLARARSLSIDPLAPSSTFDETLRTRLRDELDTREREQATGRMNPVNEGEEGDGPDEQLPATDDRVLSRDWSAPAGKKIAVPIRIEPKVYFAAERTFL
ncbi:hypothetical protein C0991_012285, partial [Blastosporella zonata]